MFLLSQSNRRKRFGGHWLRYGPTYIGVLGSLLVLADQVRHVVQDLGWWPSGPWPGSSQYISNCTVRLLLQPPRSCSANTDCGSYDCGRGFCSDGEGMPCYTCYPFTNASYITGDRFCSDNAETYACLSPVGWVFTVILTYLGFAFFFFATFWNANLIGKLIAIRDQWRALRSRPTSAAADAGAAV